MSTGIKVFNPQVVVDKVADSSAIAQLRACMESHVSGTAKHIKSPFYAIAGKTNLPHRWQIKV